MEMFLCFILGMVVGYFIGHIVSENEHNRQRIIKY